MIHGNHVSFISRSNAKGFSMFQDFSDVFRDLSKDGRAIQDFSKFQALLISRNESFERSRCRDFCRTQYLLFPPLSPFVGDRAARDNRSKFNYRFFPLVLFPLFISLSLSLIFFPFLSRGSTSTSHRRLRT